MYSHPNCAHCREVKQRRNYSKPLPENRQNLATKIHQKTDIDTIVMGNNIPGLNGERYGAVMRDESIGFVSFHGSKRRDTSSVGDALSHHFASELDKADSRGFMVYGDSAPEFKKICKKLRILYRPATPNSDESNSRHERFMGVFGDLIRNVLHQSGLPLMFWICAAQFVANVYNMTVIPYKKSKPPYAARYPNRKLPQNIPHFGQLVTFVPVNIAKHSSRSRRGILIGYSQLPGGIVTDEYRVVPLSCFTKGLKSINIITTRDIRFPYPPIFQIKIWNDLSEGRKYIEEFKPLNGEEYFKTVWEKSSNHAIEQQPDSIKVFHDGNIVDDDETVENEEDLPDEEDPELDAPDPSTAAGPPVVDTTSFSPPPVAEASKQFSAEVKKQLEKAEKDRFNRDKAAAFFKAKKTGTFTPSSSKTSSSTTTAISQTTPALSTTRSIPVLIEFACSEDSLIGKRGPFKGVKVIRLTKQTCDLLTPHGLKKALEIVRDYPGCSIHASIPCFPWSSWVKMNLHRLGDKYARKLANARQQSLKMLHAFKIVAREVISLGGHVSFEWPRYCTGWKLQQLKSFISKFGLATVDFDGCAVGLKSRKGNYIKKPWRIVTTSDSLIQSLRVKRCSGQHSHQECGGSESARSAYYTDELADHIIVGLCCQQRSQSIRDKNKKRDCSGPPAAAAIQTETSTLKNPERHQNSHCGNQKSHCGDASQSVLDTLSRQLDKAVNKATAKLAKLHQSASVTKTFVDNVKNRFIDDQQVEKQLLHRQIQQLCKEQHRQKIAPCSFNIMDINHSCT